MARKILTTDIISTSVTSTTTTKTAHNSQRHNSDTSNQPAGTSPKPQFQIPPPAPHPITLSYIVNWIRTLFQVSNRVNQLYVLALQLLQQAHITTASLDCRLLLSDTLHVTTTQLWQLQQHQLSPQELRCFWIRIFYRLRGCPIAKILHRKAFWQADFQVTKQVLDPRADSESLIELVLTIFHNRQTAGPILELGVGSGCLLLSLLQEFPQMQGVGVDLSPPALQLTSINATNLGLIDRISLYSSDLFNQLPAQSTFELIISNPPYIPTAVISTLSVEVAQYDPLIALDGGIDGLTFYRRIAVEAIPFLAPHGWLVLECGDGQAPEVKSILEQQHWHWRQSKYDLRGIERALAFQYLTP